MTEIYGETIYLRFYNDKQMRTMTSLKDLNDREKIQTCLNNNTPIRKEGH